MTARPSKTIPWTPRRLRVVLQFDTRQWARILNVSVRTVERWEDGVEPAGLPTDVLAGIAGALDDGSHPDDLRSLLELGIGGFIRHSLKHRR